MDIFGGIASILSGGLTGLLGAAVTKFADYKTKQLDQAHELAMRDKDLEISKVESEGKIRVVELEGEQAAATAASSLVSDSYKNDAATYSTAPTNPWMIAVDFVRGVIRPSLTLLFVLFTVGIYVQVANEIGVMNIKFTPDQAWAVYYYVIVWVLFNTSTVVGWWFGSRPDGPPPALKLK